MLTTSYNLIILLLIPLASIVMSFESNSNNKMTETVSSSFSSNNIVMTHTCNSLAHHVLQLAQVKQQRRRRECEENTSNHSANYNRKEDVTDNTVWICVTGGPGAGKTTLTRQVVAHLEQMTNEDMTPVSAIVIPMDGYHYSQKELIHVRDPKNGLKRKGAPWTFDAERLCNDLLAAKVNKRALFPGYSRQISEPVPNQVRLEPQHKIVFVEGNWLLLGKLVEEWERADGANKSIRGQNGDLDDIIQSMEEACPRSMLAELSRWKPLLADGLFDESWFVEPPGGVEEQVRRLIARSLETWTPQKSQAWGGGTELEAATRRAQLNDVPNAKLVALCRKYADRIIENVEVNT